MITITFLAALALFILGGARIAIWIYDENERLKQAERDALADIDAGHANDWSREEWWR